jgi:hypothetical protein
VLKLDIVALPISYFFGWIAMLIVEVPLLFKCLKKSQKIS